MPGKEENGNRIKENGGYVIDEKYSQSISAHSEVVGNHMGKSM